MRRFLSAASLSLSLLCTSCHSQSLSREDRWNEDFSALNTQFLHRQIDPFGRLHREQWQAEIAKLRKLPISGMKDAVIAVEMEHLLALYHDGHIKIMPDGSTAEPDYLNARFRWFPSGIYITVAADPKLRGAKLLRLGSVEANLLLDRIAPWISIENDSGLHAAASSSLWNAAVLVAAQVAEEGKPVPALLQLATGEETSVSLTPMPLATIHWSGSGPVPGYRQTLSPPNWLTVIPGRPIVYIRYAECRDKDRSRTLARELGKAAREGLWSFIVDLRGNEGGDSAAFGPLLDILKSRSRKGERVVALVDRGTFSSAFRNAVELKGIGATLVGEAPSQRPVYTGNVESFLLPHSRLRIRYTTKWSRLGAADSYALDPDVPAQPTVEQYLNGQDPVLDAAKQIAAT